MYLCLLCFQSYAESLNGTVPKWVEIECEEGHKYLFSDTSHTWYEARGECELYGGWLVSIGTQSEYNCLMRYGNSQGHASLVWTDGMILIQQLFNYDYKMRKSLFSPS